MKCLAALALALAIVRATPVERSNPLGIDISSYQPSGINWPAVVRSGIKFVYIKATEGTTYISPNFNAHESAGAAEARFFVAHGGGWSADGITLPGALDIEPNPDGPECYGLTPSQMVSWISDFSNTYRAATTRYPVIYTTTGWWNKCTGSNAGFANNNPLWIADWAPHLGPLPAGWRFTSFWQYADSGPNPGDADLWNGDYAGLKRMALGS